MALKIGKEQGENICNVFNKQIIGIYSIQRDSTNQFKKIQTTQKKYGENMTGQFTEEENFKTANKYMQSCSILPITRQPNNVLIFFAYWQINQSYGKN